MKNDRRQFIRDTSLTATALTFASRIGANYMKTETTVVSCGPNMKTFELTGSISSVASGKWSESATWGGKIPASTDTPVISSGHVVVFDVASANVAGVNVNSGGTLAFDTAKSVALQTTKNVVVQGKLQMRSSNAAVVQTLRFINVNENAFVGGGMDVLDSDVGLWVMGAGQLDLVGATKTSWTKASGSISQGATSVSVNDTKGWKVGDNICITPTEPPTVGAVYATGFDESSITSISGSALGLSKGTSRSHPIVNNQWTAEVMNLTRNVCIEGTVSGKTHIFIRSTAKQLLQYVAIRYVGARKDTSGDGVKELVAGRYGIHFHHCMDGSRGTLVEGVVIRDTGSHSFVPHVSHGINFVDNVAYNTIETAFWYDPGDPTHDVIYDHNLVALCNFVARSVNMNAENAPTFSSSGFALNTGDSNSCINNVVVGGGQGDPADGGAYNWEAVINEGVWTFKNNSAHNNDCGLRVWQNSTRNHVVEDFYSYHNTVGLFHGAYANSYTYTGGIFYGNGLQIKAASVNTNRVRIENITIDGANIVDYGLQVIHSPLPGEKPVFVRNVTITRCKVAAILDSAAPEVHSTDLVQCNITGAIQVHPQAVAGETIRVQPVSGQPYQITQSGKGNIAAFAAPIWGTGKGLKAEYFNSANFTSPAVTRIDSNVSFSEWSAGVHYSIKSNVYSIRWTGKVQPQFSEAYTFILSSGGAHRLYIDGKLVIDNWAEHYPDTFKSAAIKLEAGKLYDLKLEYYNNDANTGMGLIWISPSQSEEYIPQSQLYSDDIAATPTNKTPVANAGADITIKLPTAAVKLDGTASKDPDGTLTTYQWTKFSGPDKFTIADAKASATQVTGLVEGIYVFRLKVTDNNGLTNEDDVQVTVQNAAAANKAPVANAGADIALSLPNNSVNLTGAASKDPEGGALKYQWTKISGPAQFAIANSTAVTTAISGLAAGTYVIRLKVTDTAGVSAEDDVQVVVSSVDNKAPIAKAGNDIAIKLPVSSVTLNATGSVDSDGYLVSSLWTKVSGPASGAISNPSSWSTGVNGLVEGVYIFRLKVTDNKGLSSEDDVKVTVTGIPKEGTDLLTITASPNPSVNSFGLIIKATNANVPVVMGIYNSKGLLVERISTFKGTRSVIVGSKWDKGTYFVIAQQGAIKRTLTLIKN